MSMVVVSARIPKELKEKAKVYGIDISEVLRRALEKEIRKRELKEIDELLNKLRRELHGITTEEIVRVIRESREER